MLVFSCYNCGLITDLDEGMAGRTWQCPACRQSVTIPGKRKGGREGGPRTALGSVVLVLAGLIPGLAVGGAGGLLLGKRNAGQGGPINRPLAEDPPKPRSARVAVSYLDAADLYDEYLTCESDCDQVYKDKVVQVVGTVGDRNDGRSGDPFIHLLHHVDGKTVAVKCHFDNDRRAEVARVSRDRPARIRVLGVCRSFSVANGVELFQCELVE